MSLDSLETLYAEQLQDLRSAESQLIKALPKVAAAAESEELREAIEGHLEETKQHLERINEALSMLKEPGKKVTCEAMEGLVKETDEVLEEDGDPAVKDAALIAGAQKVEHYEIGSYGTVIAWARRLGQDKAVELLEQTLEEEKAADEKLTEIAESTVNEMAMEGESEE